MTGTTAPNAVVHVVVDGVENYQQADGAGNFTIQAWGLDLGQHLITLQASEGNSKDSQQKQYITTVSPGVVTTTVSGIELPIDTPTLPANLQRFDLNHDGQFGFQDILLFLEDYHGSNMEFDFNHDGRVDLSDFSIMISYYLSTAR